MSDVVVSVVESNTAVTVTEQDVAVDVTENNVVVSVSTAGIQGVPGANNDPTYVTVRNATGATLAKGTIVYISGANGNNVQVTPALATGDLTSARTLGWLAASIPNNGSGLCMVEGYLEGLNTQGITAGAQLYLSGTVAGGFTETKPVAPTHLVYVGVATKISAGDGHVFVKVQNGYELGELHDVLIVSPTNNQVLAYDSATQLWKNATNAPDGVTSITAVSPLTGGTITSTGSIGLNQALLSITKSQVSDFTSGTVTSAGTAQQAGTAVYSVNSGTALYATTSGTAVFATNASTAVNLSGSITKSQVSDFTSGTVTSASTAQQSGTAVFANTSGTATYATTSGTATYADTSGTATYATDAGTAVYATTSGTAVTISGSITQSQVTNLTTDLAGKANLAGGNAFTGAQTISTGGTANKGLVVQGVASQAVNLFEVQDSTGAFRVRVNQVGNSTFAGNITSQNNALFTPFSAATVPLTVQGASGQTGNLQEWQNNAGTVQARVTSGGSIVTTQGFAVLGGASISGSIASLFQSASAARIPVVVQGAASQSANLQEWQSSAGGTVLSVNSAGLLTGTRAFAVNQSNSGEAMFVLRGAASQTGDALAVRDSSANTIAGFSATGRIYSGVSGSGQTYLGGLTLGGGSVASQLGVVAGAATTVGAVIRGAASQSADALQIQTSDGTTQARFSPIGYLQIGAGTNPGGQLGIPIGAAANRGMVIQAAASQSADLVQVLNSAAGVIARIQSNGVINGAEVRTNSTQLVMREVAGGGNLYMARATSLPSNPGANIGTLYFRDGTNAGTLKLCVRAGAAGAETTILDNIPQ